ncbi:MAG: hypothetical protein UHO61_02100 [Acutalibacteraceae bacterium]|nr:hypothetical protein [Acutalibacteraceae bacterium]
MKFSALQRTEQKSIKIRNFKAGTVMSGLADIPDNALSNSENMWRENGALCTRAGLYADLENIIKSENPPLYDSFTYMVADSTVCINGKYKKIAVEGYCEEESVYYCNIFFVDADGSSTPTGNLVFNRITSNDFYTPTNILFYSGSPVNGAGIFAFVSTANIYNYSEKSYRIYELSANANSWQEFYDFYVPVLYINGRGNRYEEAKSTCFAYTGTPMFLETQNLLTDRFKAYFTSDGYSSSFRLPVTDLNNNSVICRVYTNTDTYTEWVIYEGRNSVTAKFYNANITFNVDREKGIVYFTESQGDYPVPMISKYHENNICVTAGKTIKNGFESAASSTCCASYGSRIVFSGGTERGRLFSIRSDNPLYFPCDSVCNVGENDGVNMLLSYKNGVLAFKQNEIYAITIKNGSAINSTSLLADDGSVFYNSDSFTLKKISGDKGLKNKRTCLLCGNEAVFLGSDQAVYSLNTSSFEVTKLSEAIDGYLKNLKSIETENAFAVQNENRYLLLMGEKAVIMDFKDGGLKNPAWYLWTFPNSKALGGFSSSGQLCIICTGTDGNVLYTAKLSGNTDTDICRSGDTPTAENRLIYGMAQTKNFDFGNMNEKKLIDSISLSASAKGKVEIFINDKRFDALSFGKSNVDYACDTLNSVKLIPHLSPVKSLRLKFSSDKDFSLGEIIINYRKTV